MNAHQTTVCIQANFNGNVCKGTIISIYQHLVCPDRTTCLATMDVGNQLSESNHAPSKRASKRLKTSETGNMVLWLDAFIFALHNGMLSLSTSVITLGLQEF